MKVLELFSASPVCLWWSALRRTIDQNKRQSDIDKFGKPMVDKVREIIHYFKPKYYFIENPQSGLMKTYITDLQFYDVDYCMYGFDYRKRTRIWTNLIGFEPKKCKKDCGKMVKIDGHHLHKSNCGNSLRLRLTENTSTSKLDRYRIPPNLIRDLFKQIESLEQL